MINIKLNKLIFITLVFTSISLSLDLGIESFEKQKDGTYLADIYMLNEK